MVQSDFEPMGTTVIIHHIVFSVSVCVSVCVCVQYLRSAMVQPHCESMGVTAIIYHIVFSVVMIHQCVNHREVHQVVVVSVQNKYKD